MAFISLIKSQLIDVQNGLELYLEMAFINISKSKSLTKSQLIDVQNGLELYLGVGKCLECNTFYNNDKPIDNSDDNDDIETSDDSDDSDDSGEEDKVYCLYCIEEPNPRSSKNHQKHLDKYHNGIECTYYDK